MCVLLYLLFVVLVYVVFVTMCVVVIIVCVLLFCVLMLLICVYDAYTVRIKHLLFESMKAFLVDWYHFRTGQIFW